MSYCTVSTLRNSLVVLFYVLAWHDSLDTFELVNEFFLMLLDRDVFIFISHRRPMEVCRQLS